MPMVVGLCTLELFLPDNGSLKEKRRVLKSIKDRLRRKFNISISELGGQDLWQKSILGMACVGNEKRHVNQVLDSAVGLVRSTPMVEIIQSRLEIM